MRISITFSMLVLMTALFIGCTKKSTPTIDTNSQKNTDTTDSSGSVSNQTSDADIVFENDLYKINTFGPEGDLPDGMHVYNKQKKKDFNFDNYFCSFVAVVDSFMIIDSGTGTTRGLTIYNLNSGETTFQTNYQGDLKVEGKQVRFQSQVVIEDKSKRPVCPEGFENEAMGEIQYKEDQIFDLSTLLLTKTGKCECTYFE